jgi:hypothetical protein
LGFAQSYYFEREVLSKYSVGLGKKEINGVTNEQVYVHDQMMKIIDKKSGRARILRLDKKLIYELNTNKKIYTEKDFRTVGIAQNQGAIQSSMSEPQRYLGMQTAREKVLESTTGVDAAQRSVMQQMMMQQQAKMMAQRQVEESSSTPASPASIALKWTNETKKINGYLCKRFKAALGKKRLYEGWVTEEAGPQNYYADFITGNESLKGDLVAELKKVVGFPMREKYRVQEGQNVGAINSVKVTLVENRTLTPFDFEIPTGYSLEGVSVLSEPVKDTEDDW